MYVVVVTWYAHLRASNARSRRLTGNDLDGRTGTTCGSCAGEVIRRDRPTHRSAQGFPRWRRRDEAGGIVTPRFHLGVCKCCAGSLLVVVNGGRYWVVVPSNGLMFGPILWHMVGTFPVDIPKWWFRTDESPSLVCDMARARPP